MDRVVGFVSLCSGMNLEGDPLRLWSQERGLEYLGVDIRGKGGQGWNLCAEAGVWSVLLWAAAQGRVVAVLSSPPHRTWTSENHSPCRSYHRGSVGHPFSGHFCTQGKHDGSPGYGVVVHRIRSPRSSNTILEGNSLYLSSARINPRHKVRSRIILEHRGVERLPALGKGKNPHVLSGFLRPHLVMPYHHRN